jgi:hypothetical protein
MQRQILITGGTLIAMSVIGISGSVGTAKSGPSSLLANSATTTTTIDLHSATVQRQTLSSGLVLQASTRRLSVVLQVPDGLDATYMAMDNADVAKGDVILRFQITAASAGTERATLEDAEFGLRDAQTAQRSAVSTADLAVEKATAGLAKAREGQRLALLPPEVDGLVVAAAKQAVTDAEFGLRDAQTAQTSAVTTADLAVEKATKLIERSHAIQSASGAKAGVVLAPFAGRVAVQADHQVRLDGAYAVDAELLPLQMLRLQSGEITATARVETVNGSHVVACTEVALLDTTNPVAAAVQSIPSAPIPSASALNAPLKLATPTAPMLSCTPTRALNAISGLRAELDVRIQVGVDVLVLPDAAITTTSDGGTFVTRTDGSIVPITVGSSDGILRVVSGIEEGAQVTV